GIWGFCRTGWWVGGRSECGAEGVGSYFPPLHRGDLLLHVSVDCSRARRNSLSAAAAVRACGVSGGSRPLGGSTISEVRFPTRLLDKNTAWLYARATSGSGPDASGLSSL